MGSLQPYFSFYQFPTGRRLFAMRRVAEVARHNQLAETATLADAAVAQAQRAAEREASWRRSRGTTPGKRKRAGNLDAAIDRTLGGMVAQLGGTVRAFGSEGIGATAAALLSQLFPEGATAITNLSYEEELAATEVVVNELNGAHAEDADAVGLTPFVRRLELLVSDFRDALKEEDVREISYDEVRADQAEGQELMLRVAAKILGDYGGTSEEHARLRSELMAPIMSQNRRIGERFSSRRPPSDVNPETGEELPEIDGDTAAVAN